MEAVASSSASGLLGLIFQYATSRATRWFKSQLCRRQAIVLSEGKSTLCRNLISISNEDFHICDAEAECLATLTDDKRKALSKLNLEKDFTQASRLLQVYVREYVRGFEKEYAGCQVLYLLSSIALARFLNINPALTYVAVPTSEFVDVIQIEMGQMEKLQFNQERSEALMKSGNTKNKVLPFGSWEELTETIKRMYGLGNRL